MTFVMVRRARAGARVEARARRAIPFGASMKRIARVLFAAALVVIAPPVALAQRGDLVDRGIELRRRGDDEGAARLFREAYEQDHSPRALAQLALAEQALGRWVDASEHLRAALDAASDPWIRSRRAVLEEATQEIARHVGRLEVRCNCESGEVRVGGRVVATLPIRDAMLLVAGTIEVEVRAPGYVGETHAVRIVADGLSRESFELAREPAASSSPASSSSAEAQLPSTAGQTVAARSSAGRDEGRGPWTTVGWIGVGTGAAAIAFGIVAWQIREGHARTWNSDECLLEPGTRETNCGGERTGAELWQSVMLVSLAAGAAIGIAGVALVVADPGGTSAQDARATSVSCWPTAGAAWGASCRATF